MSARRAEPSQLQSIVDCRHSMPAKVSARRFIDRRTNLKVTGQGFRSAFITKREWRGWLYNLAGRCCTTINACKSEARRQAAAIREAINDTVASRAVTGPLKKESRSIRGRAVGVISSLGSHTGEKKSRRDWKLPR